MESVHRVLVSLCLLTASTNQHPENSSGGSIRGVNQTFPDCRSDVAIIEQQVLTHRRATIQTADVHVAIPDFTAVIRQHEFAGLIFSKSFLVFELAVGDSVCEAL